GGGFVAGDRGAEEQQIPVWGGGGPVPHGGGGGAQPAGSGRGDRGLDGVGQVVVAVRDELGEQRVAVGEVAVEGGAGDTHPLADRVDRDAGDAVLGQLFERDPLGLLAG